MQRILDRLARAAGRRKRQRNESRWDNPETGTDLLAVMIYTDRMRKERKLPQ